MSDEYRIRIRGHIDPSWSEYMAGFNINHQPDGTTDIVGSVVDQAALQGLLDRIHSLGLTLLLVEQVE